MLCYAICDAGVDRLLGCAWRYSRSDADALTMDGGVGLLRISPCISSYSPSSSRSVRCQEEQRIALASSEERSLFHLLVSRQTVAMFSDTGSLAPTHPTQRLAPCDYGGTLHLICRSGRQVPICHHLRSPSHKHCLLPLVR
jgi:hypothetical protein